MAIWGVLIGVLVAGTPYAQAYDNVYDAGAYYTMGDADFSFNQLQDILNAPNPPSTLEGVLNTIHLASPSLFENHILMYRSKSFQASSEANPRAIVFNRDASMVFSFNGHPSQRGYDRIEIIHFIKGEDRFELREITVRDGRATMSPPNPKLCLSCHQSPDRKNIDPRPNWEPYNRWPGAIGSEGANFTKNFQLEVYLPQDELHRAEAEREPQILKDFYEKSLPGHPRYGFLKPLDQRKAMELPTRFTDFIGRLNFFRIMRLAKEDAPEHFEKFKDIFASAVYCGQMFAEGQLLTEIENRTPDSHEQFVVRKSDLMRDRIRDITWSYFNDDGNHTKVAAYPPRFPGLRISEAIYLVFEAYGIDVTDWAMDFKTRGRLAFAERFGLPSSPQDAARRAFEARYPETKGLTCEQRAQIVIPQIKEKMATLPVLPEKVSKPLIEACIRCHAGATGDAPYIPFDKRDLLKAALSSTTKSGRTLIDDIRYRLSDHATLDEQMPRTLNRPTLKERTDLIQYLESL